MKRTTCLLLASLLTLGSPACSDDENDTGPAPDAGSSDAPVDDVFDSLDSSGEDANSESGPEASTEASAEASAEASMDAGEVQADALLAAYLTGRFDSEAQSKTDYAYYAIQLTTCAVSVPELGERVLYVEQARMDTPSQPYRQRLYVIEPLDPPQTRAVSNIYEIVKPSAAVGLCSDPTSLTLTLADVVEKDGCGVEMEWTGSQFEGGTTGKECASTLNGASYTTSEVTLTHDTMSSWDRGFDDQDVQVWGATKGPYVFDRKTPLELP
jgi:hypothetical protein